MASDPHWNKVVLALKCDGTNGSTTFTDSSASAKTVTANGNAQISTAQSAFAGGASGYFDGTGDYLSVASSADFGFGTGDFTIECWVNTAGTNRSVWDNRTTTEAGTGYIATTTGRIGFWNNVAAFEGTTNIANNAWHHLAWCRASGILRLFVDGVAEYTGAMTSDLGTSRPLRIGRDYLNAGDFTGYIDDLRVTKGVARYTANFTPPTTSFPTQLPVISGVVKDSSGNFAQRLVRAFDRKTGAFLNATLSNPTTGAYSIPVATADETMVIANDAIGDPYGGNVVLAMHMDGVNNSTTFVDETGKTVTANGNVQISTAQSKFGGASAYFDGTGDYLSVASSNDFGFGTSDFTIECWAYWTSHANWRVLACQRTAYNSNYQFIFLTDVSGNLVATTSTSGTTDAFTVSGPSAVPAGQWNHVAFVRGGTTMKVYLNGVAGTSVTCGTAALFVSSATVKVGADGDGTSSFLGYIDDLRITKGVARYTANFTPPTAAFLGPLSGGTENALIYDRVIPA